MSRSSSAPKSKDTVNGFFYFYPDDDVNIYITTDKVDVDELQAKLCEEQGHMDQFWKALEPKTKLIPDSAFSNVSVWREKLIQSGCKDRVPDFERMVSTMEDIKRRLRNFNMYARKMHKIIVNARKDKRQEAITRVKKMIVKAEPDRKPGKDLTTEDEYILEERALSILEQYPVEDIQTLLDIGNNESTIIRFQGQKLEEWKASVQGDILLLEKTIQQLKDGQSLHNWAVDVPNLESEEYKHFNLLRDSEVFTTNNLTVEQKKTLIKQAEQELNKEAGSAD